MSEDKPTETPTTSSASTTDVVSQIKYILGALGYSFDEHINFTKKDSFGRYIIKDTESVAFEILNYKTINKIPGLNKDIITSTLVWYKKEYPQQEFSKHRQKIQHDATAINRTEELVDAIAGKNHLKIYDTIFNQVGYCIKKRMYGEIPEYPIWLNLSGRDNVGKSYFLKKWMSSIIPSSYILKPKSTNDGNVLNNLEKNGHLFIEKYALIFGELAGMSDVKIPQIKDIIDDDEIAYRAYYSQGSIKGKNNAQLLSASNHHLKETFQRDDSIRKYCDIPFIVPDTIEEMKARWKVIDTFDYLEWIKSINENDESPLKKVYPEYLEWVKKDCYKPTETEVWVSGYINQNLGKEILFGTIFNDYGHCNIKMKISKTNDFSKMLVKQGCVKLEVKTNKGFKYKFPSSNDPLEGAEIYFTDFEEKRTGFPFPKTPSLVEEF
jgi:hypothetical protein